MIEILFRLPYSTRQHLTDAKFGILKTVGNYLIAPKEYGLLKSVKLGKEKTLFKLKLNASIEK